MGLNSVSQEPQPSAAAQDNPTIVLTDVEKVYRGRRGRTHALARTSLTIDKGTFVSLVGPSGCGKSTLLNIIAGLLKVSSGEVVLDQQKVVRPSQHVGMMFQQSVLLPWRTVIGNILLPTQIQKLDRSRYVDRARTLLEQVRLGGFERHYPRELSGGMQQRVAICRALITDPSVLLLDEPFGALDSITREGLNDLLSEICAETHKTTVLVTHDIDEAVYLADRVLVMSPRPGRVVKDMKIDLPRPRVPGIRRLTEFADYTAEAREVLGMVS